MKFRRAEFWLVVLLTLVGAVLRGVDTLGRSMWPDEGATYLRVVQTWSDVLSNVLYISGSPVFDTQPPFYFLILKAWGMVAGTEEFSLKWITVLAGILITPLHYVLCKRLFGTRAGLLATVFLLLSAGVQWYSRELRMYTVIECIAIFATYALFRAVLFHPRQAYWWVIWEIAIAISIFTHYTFAGLVLAHGLIGLALIVRHWAKIPASHKLTLLTSIGVTLLLSVAFILQPSVQALFARLSTGREASYSFVPFETIVWSEMSGFIFGLNVPNPNAAWLDAVTWLATLGCILGFVVRAQPQNAVARWLAFLSFVLPMFVWFSISFIKPNYQGFRHLMLVIPFAAALLGRLLAELWTHKTLVPKATAFFATFALLISQTYGMVYSFTHTHDWHDDYRSLANYIRHHWRDGDIVIIDSPTHYATVMEYLRGFPSYEQPFPQFATQLEQTAFADSFRQKYHRVWYAIPSGRRDWLNQNGILREQIVFPSRSVGITLFQFDLQPALTKRLPENSIPLPLQNPSPAGVALVGYRFESPARFNPQPNTTLSLFWQKQTPVFSLSNTRVSFRLLHENETWWDWLLPVNLSGAPSNWQQGEYFRTEHILPLPIGLPKLDYTLAWAVRAGDKSESFQTTQSSLLQTDLACCVRVLHWPPRPVLYPALSLQEAAQPDTRSLLTWNNIAEQAKQFLPQSNPDVALTQSEFPQTTQPGNVLNVVLTWQQRQANIQGWQTQLSLRSLTNAAITDNEKQIVPSFFILNEPVRDQYALSLPYPTSAGWYRLSLSRWRNGAKVDETSLGWVQVKDYDRTSIPTPSQIAQPVTATVGAATLLGYSTTKPFARGETTEVYTHWQFNAQPMRDGVISVHSTLPNGEPGPQDDNPPILPDGSVRSTLTFRTNDGLSQIHRLTIAQNAPAGEYKLYALIYDKADGSRWSASSAKDDLVYLGSFILQPLPQLTFRYFLPAVVR